MLIKAAFNAVEKKFAEMKEEFSSYYEMPPKYIKSKSDTDRFPLGIHFGNKIHERLPAAISDNDDMKKELLMKVKKVYKNFIDDGLIPAKPITIDTIHIKNTGKTLRGEVVCVFCGSNDISQKKNRCTV